jgi:hypothetical protein
MIMALDPNTDPAVWPQLKIPCHKCGAEAGQPCTTAPRARKRFCPPRNNYVAMATSRKGARP